MVNILRIKDVCSRFSSGRSISASEIAEVGKYPVFGGNGLRGYTETYNFDGECAVIGRQGAYCGNVRYFSGKAYMTEHAIVAVANENNNTRFLAYKFSLMGLGRYAGQSAQPGLSVETLLDVDIDVPDKPVQDGVAKVLSAIDDKIRINRSVCSDLEAMAKLLYDYWFVQFDFPDEKGKPYKSSGGKMVWNDELKREIPEGWEVHRASEYISPVRGVSYSAEDLLGDGIPMFNLNSFNEDGTYKTAGLKTFSGAVADDRLVAPHDLIMCVTQQTDIDLTGKRNVIGKALFVPDLGQSRMTMSMDVVKLIADDPAKLAFFKYFFGLGYAHKYVVGYANGTKIKHLDIDGALSVPVAIPPKSSPLIQAFSERALTVSDAISNALNESQRLAELRDFLLPMLMNGQVKVE